MIFPYYTSMIIDAHLDLAYNALDLGRDMTLSLEESRKVNPHTDIPTVTLPALREGGVAVAFATLWANPRTYLEPQQAHEAALRQLEVYQRWEEGGWIRLLRSRADLEAHLTAWNQDRVLGVVILMEGAEPIRQPDELPFWRQQGVRMVGLSWAQTRYAGGTAQPGGLTPLGHELLGQMAAHGVALDLAHMDHQAVIEAFPVWSGPICATHANPFHFLPTNRHLKDEVIDELGRRGGVVGIVPYNGFMVHGWTRGQERIPLSVVGEHLEYYARRMGWSQVAIGSDMDGGFGLLEMPQGLDDPGSLSRIATLVPPDQAEGVLAGNWLRWLRQWF